MADVVSPEARRDATLLVSYLADAVRLGEAAGFAKHVAWLRAHKYPHTAEVLRALSREPLPRAARTALETAR